MHGTVLRAKDYVEHVSYPQRYPLKNVVAFSNQWSLNRDVRLLSSENALVATGKVRSKLTMKCRTQYDDGSLKNLAYKTARIHFLKIST